MARALVLVVSLTRDFAHTPDKEQLTHVTTLHCVTELLTYTVKLVGAAARGL
jgi:hypothetical protein